MEKKQSNHFLWAILAMNAAAKATEVILTVYNAPFDTVEKEDGSPVTKADLASNEILVQALSTTNVPVLSEEQIHQSYDERSKWTEFWCVDPLDGTKEFIKKNHQFAINIALLEKNVPVLGIIAEPVKRRFLVGGRDLTPAIVHYDDIEFKENWIPLLPKQAPNKPVVVVSSYAPYNIRGNEFLAKLNERVGETKAIHRGSALKFYDLALESADIYPRFAPTMEWDIAAGHAILKALNGEVYNAATLEPLEYNKQDLRNPNFVAVTQPLKQVLLHEVLV